MNIWTEKSIELASQRNYLDLLYQSVSDVYQFKT